MVCSGAGCQATFEDTVFDRCSLVVLSAARATLSKVAFKNMKASPSGLGMIVHGLSSRVAVQGGTVAGGTQGVVVQAGGDLEPRLCQVEANAQRCILPCFRDNIRPLTFVLSLALLL